MRSCNTKPIITQLHDANYFVLLKKIIRALMTAWYSSRLPGLSWDRLSLSWKVKWGFIFTFLLFPFIVNIKLLGVKSHIHFSFLYLLWNFWLHEKFCSVTDVLTNRWAYGRQNICTIIYLQCLHNYYTKFVQNIQYIYVISTQYLSNFVMKLVQYFHVK